MIEAETVQPEATAATLPVAVPVFTGPLDLLMHLIRKNKVSIYDIPIAEICEQYHSYLEAMQELDLEIAGEFVWMAAWLIHVKSQTLLPRATESGEDPRQELVDRLLEYRRVKQLAEVLYEKDVVRRCLWLPRVTTDRSREEQEIDWEDVDLRVLARTYLEVMDRFAAAHPPPLQVLPLRYRVKDVMADLYARVTSEKVVPLLRHIHGRTDTEEMVVLVVSALELVRLGAVCAEQNRAFAEVYLRAGSVPFDASELARTGEVSGS